MRERRDATSPACVTCDGDGYIEKWVEDDEGRDYPIALPCPDCGPTREKFDA